MNSTHAILSETAPEVSKSDGLTAGDGQGNTRGEVRRILFLCGALEPGRDGVGDYTRVLMAHCRELGVECCAVALNDHHVTQPAEEVAGRVTTELRLPATMPWAERVAAVTKLRQQFQPDWVSLQFVPYAFNAKGIVWNMASRLRSMVGEARLQVMFHELWIGGARRALWKERVVGTLQKANILRLFRALAPDSTATSNGTYVEMLRRYGVSARKLALFGNVPVAATAPAKLRSMLAARTPFDVNRRDRCWVVAFFGTLHPEWNAEPLFSTIHRAATAAGRRVCFVAVGRLGVVGESKWSLMAERYGASLSFVNLGVQEVEVVSQLLQEADFGIAASPWQLIGKSGSATAMLEHGLPVIVNRDDWHARDIGEPGDELDPLLHRCDGLLEGKLVAGLPKREPMNRAPEIARQFVRGLSLKTA
jgi:hypothetical protein